MGKKPMVKIKSTIVTLYLWRQCKNQDTIILINSRRSGMNLISRKLEDPTRPYIGPNYWILMKSGILLPRNKLAKIIYMIIHFLITLFVFTQYMELYVIRSDLHLVLTTLRITMLSMVCVVKVNTFLFWQNEWKEVLAYVTAADKFERDNQDETRGEIIKKYTRYGRRMSYFYWALAFSTFVAGVLAPLMKYLSSSTFRENLHNGTEMFPHIFISWMPFDKNHTPGCWVTVLWHGLLCFYGGLYMAAFDSCVIVIMVFFGGKIDLLRERSRQIIGFGDIKDFREIIRELHGIHMNLLKYSRLFNSVLSPPMFLYIAVCSIMLCASIYQLDSGSTAAEKVMLAQYLMFGIAQLFLFCWHSNDVLVKCDSLAFGVYSSDWCTLNLNQRKEILIIMTQFRTKIIFTAGPFTNITLPTFITILKAAYSYYTLIRQ